MCSMQTEQMCSHRNRRKKEKQQAGTAECPGVDVSTKSTSQAVRMYGNKGAYSRGTPQQQPGCWLLTVGLSPLTSPALPQQPAFGTTTQHSAHNLDDFGKFKQRVKFLSRKLMSESPRISNQHLHILCILNMFGVGLIMPTGKCRDHYQACCGCHHVRPFKHSV